MYKYRHDLSSGTVMVQVHIMDGIQFVRDVATTEAVDGLALSSGGITEPLSNGNSTPGAAGKCSNKVDILVVDVDSSDSR